MVLESGNGAKNGQSFAGAHDLEAIADSSVLLEKGRVEFALEVCETATEIVLEVDPDPLTSFRESDLVGLSHVLAFFFFLPGASRETSGWTFLLCLSSPDLPLYRLSQSPMSQTQI